ncbi:MAG: hypothetical protein U0559_03560 [Anaerolineae bacterium]
MAVADDEREFAVHVSLRLLILSIGAILTIDDDLRALFGNDDARQPA